ncbi:MAG: hypothetical protein IKO56_07275 [Alphaproteobacteria bacterium]|nr:hypothetical protein [Alphaproteobacteria bacterium]
MLSKIYHYEKTRQNVHDVGDADTWGKRTLPEYTVDGNKKHSLSFILRLK